MFNKLFKAADIRTITASLSFGCATYTYQNYIPKEFKPFQFNY
jgi:hypothetical protein